MAWSLNDLGMERVCSKDMRPGRSMVLLLILLTNSTCAPKRSEPLVHAEPSWSAKAIKESAAGPIEIPPSARAAISFEEGFAPVVERVRRAVVNVASTKVSTSKEEGEPSFFDLPQFRDFFGFGGPGEPRRHPSREQALGSGVLVSRDGLILTNNHVVQGASDIVVSLADKRELHAKVVGTDPKTDIALLRISGDDYPFLELGDSDRVRVGQFALAIGDPLGLGQTVTFGIISAVGRGNVGIVDYEDFLQTDAAINPGNSGGALVNVSGQLIGIPTAIATTGGATGNQGIGFAVPVKIAREVMAQIKAHGRVVRGFLGVAVQDLSADVASALGTTSGEGALVSDVPAGSPAARAGITRGDVIVSFNGHPIVSSRDLRLRVAETSPGTTVTLGVRRGTSTLDIRAQLSELPSNLQSNEKAAPNGTGPLGLRVAPAVPELLRRLSLPETTTGVVVLGVEGGSRAEAAGLHAGDVVQEVNHASVRSPDELDKAVSKGADGPLLLLILRGGHPIFLAIPPAKKSG